MFEMMKYIKKHERKKISIQGSRKSVPSVLVYEIEISHLPREEQEFGEMLSKIRSFLTL